MRQEIPLLLQMALSRQEMLPNQKETYFAML
jgi:hypothetical protein